MQKSVSYSYTLDEELDIQEFLAFRGYQVPKIENIIAGIDSILNNEGHLAGLVGVRPQKYPDSPRTAIVINPTPALSSAFDEYISVHSVFQEPVCLKRTCANELVAEA